MRQPSFTACKNRQKITRNLETRWIARKRRKSTMIGYAEVDEYWLKSISWNWIMMKLMSKKAWGKIKKQVLRRESWLIHHLQNMSHQKIYTFWYYVVNDEVPSTSSQIVERIVTYSRCSFTRNIYLEWLSTREEIKGDQTQFSPKMVIFYIIIIFAIKPVGRLCYRIINSLILQ